MNEGVIASVLAKFTDLMNAALPSQSDGSPKEALQYKQRFMHRRLLSAFAFVVFLFGYAPEWLDQHPGAFPLVVQQAAQQSTGAGWPLSILRQKRLSSETGLPIQRSGDGSIAIANRDLPDHAVKVGHTGLHSHNDYRQSRPLYDALEAGCGSIEVDLHGVAGRVVVSHGGNRLRSKPTFESLYLKALRSLLAANGGRVFAEQAEPLVLMLDYKSPAASLHSHVVDLLEGYPELFCTDTVLGFSPVRVVVSGNRPAQLHRAECLGIGLDGRLEDLRRDVHPDRAMPRISDAWSDHFSWNGRGKMPKEQWDRLQAYAEAALELDLRLRFWAAPDRKDAWAAQLEAGVGWINTDKPMKASLFLRSWNDQKDTGSGTMQ
jgi:hypothetical protein